MPGSSRDLQLMELKDIILQQNKMLQEQAEAIKAMKQALAEKEASDAEHAREKACLQEQIDYLKSKLFGKSSERQAQVDGQTSIFDSDPGEAAEGEEEQAPDGIVIKEHVRKRKATRQEKFHGIPQTEDVIELPEDKLGCPVCGTKMEPVGKEFVRYEFEFIPASGMVHKIYKMNYACPECREHAGEPLPDMAAEGAGQEEDAPERGCVFASAEVPPALIEKSFATPSCVAHVMYQKYCQAVPLYRQEKDWAQLGLELGRETMAAWVIRCSQRYLEPVFGCMRDVQIARGFLMADESPLQVLKEKDRTAQQKSYMWVFRTGEDGLPPVILFLYSETRKGRNAAEFLEGFHGYLETDGFGGYNKLEDVKRCGCWAHVRRKFFESIPKGKKNDLSEPAVQGVQYCSKLFEKERLIVEKCGKDYEKRKEERLRLEKPVLEAFWSWLEKQTPMSGSKLATAVTYARNQKPFLETYLEDGRCSISNNLSEQEMKNYVIGRKNWLFSDTPAGAKASAIVYSMVETARANAVNIFEYLKYLLEHRPTDATPKEDILKLMPWEPEVQEACKIKSK